MNLTDNDRRVIIVAVTLLGLVSLLGFIVLAGLVLYRLNDGEDIQPGQVALLLGLLGLTTTSISLLIPSPLSKTSGASDEPVPVVVQNEPDDAVPTEDVKGKR